MEDFQVLKERGGQLQTRPPPLDRGPEAGELVQVLAQMARKVPCVAMWASAAPSSSSNTRGTRASSYSKVIAEPYRSASSGTSAPPVARRTRARCPGLRDSLVFMHPSITSARDADLFALGCCQLGAFVPLTVLTMRSPAVVRHLFNLGRARFPMVPSEFLRRMQDRLALSPDLRPYLPLPPATASLPLDEKPKTSLQRGITRAATPDRTDRLFPGDIAVHRPGGALSLANGASGVLLAQHIVGT
ncbi:hypothetical protein WBG99_11150 [Streptomyces sp. TG1A-60]|uniref:hypothetical protein n=2 Tax=Streptomyces sp. TG1A-60 TaxID=3129111 RepID=UPI0030D4BABB